MVEQMLDKTQILDQFLSSGERFVAAVRDLPEAALDYSAAPGEWTIRQIVHHVSDDADLWSFGLKKAIASPGSALRFEGFPGNECWFATLNFTCRPVGPSLDLILAHRQVMVDIAACAGENWDAFSIELFDDKGSPLGKLGVGQILGMLTNHISEHLHTVETIRQQHGL